MDAAIRVSDQTPLCSAMGIDTIPNTAVGIDTHTKTDNVRVYLFRSLSFPSGKSNGPISNKSKGYNNNGGGGGGKAPQPGKTTRRHCRNYVRAEEQKTLRIGKLMPIRDLRSAIELLLYYYCGKMRGERRRKSTDPNVILTTAFRLPTLPSVNFNFYES